jgi:hypothetical protein
LPSNGSARRLIIGARRSSFGALKGAGRRLRMDRVGKPRGIRKPSSVE